MMAPEVCSMYRTGSLGRMLFWVASLGLHKTCLCSSVVSTTDATDDLDQSVDMSTAEWGRTPLHEAAEFGHLEMLRGMLAEANESSVTLVSAPDELGWTPLHWAALHGEEEMASELLRAQAAVDAQEYEFGCQPLQWAARRGHLRLLRLLLDAGASAEYADRQQRTAAAWAKLTGHAAAAALLEASEDSEETSEPHMYSRAERDTDEVEDAMTEADQAYGMTALHVAAASGRYSDVAKWLGASEPTALSSQMSAQDMWGRTPLVTAIQTRKSPPKAALKLLHTELCVTTDHDGRGPLHWAVLAGDLRLFKELRLLNQSQAPPDRFGRTLVHYAAANGHGNILSELLADAADVDVDAKDRSQQTPLHLASARGHAHLVQQLLDRNASWNVSDLLLRRPLHYAAMFGHLDVIKLLMNAGADYFAEDLDGETVERFMRRTPFLH
ncbi:ANK3 [Symbiodinium necroappetens]|uniref:ANK3 protein n=1 Tax=Symbiodinium necroappetens TaxID=1628268 RepID=A0A812WBQ6_9DINO|nr:ANK3 [Symbiodinium necroappetens]